MAEVAVLRSRADALFTRSGGLHPPTHVILNWPLPNRVDPEERGWEAPATIIAILCITILVYGARIWARLVVAKNAGVDDLLMSLSMLPLIGLTISAVLAVRVYGFQWHTWDQTVKTLVTSREITMAIELNYIVSTTLIKISILCFYRRITGSLTNGFVRWVWISIVLCAVYGVVFCLLIIFTCSPQIGFFRLFDMSWRLQHEVKCLNEGAIIVACAIISTVQDLVICLLPVFLIWNLKMPKRQKAALCGIFGMGLVTCVCGILRTYYATFVYYSTYDITWYAYYGWIWTAIEADLGVICASAPALKVFFNRYFSLPTRSGYGGASSNMTPVQPSRSNNKAAPFRAAHSAGASRVEPEDIHDYGTPLKGITVSQGLDIRVEERDDLSQKSFGSTRELTALSTSKESGWKTPTEWTQNVRTALTSGSHNHSRSHITERDLERGA